MARDEQICCKEVQAVSSIVEHLPKVGAASILTLPRRRLVWDAWGPLIVLPVAALSAANGICPRWVVMWSLALGVYAGCKWLTWRSMTAPQALWPAHLAYLLAWPGMDAAAFLAPAADPSEFRPSPREWLFAAGKTLLGAALIGGLSMTSRAPAWLIPWAGMAGIVFFLHFGIFHLLSCLWRSARFDAAPLMNWPILAISVGDFWGRRWNLAFRDLTRRFVFRPLSRRLGARRALLAGFAVSGLIHDLVISVPAGGGYGLPTLYFAIQGLAATLERSEAGGRIGLGAGLRGRLFAVAALVLPVPLLFHAPFIERVIVPMLSAPGAIA
jgi:alginate O-acetyltransferase complex protein AlgI